MVIPFCRRDGCFNNATSGVWCHAHKPASTLTPADERKKYKAEKARREREAFETEQRSHWKMLERWARGDLARYLADDFWCNIQTVRNRAKKYATDEQRARRAAALGGKNRKKDGDNDKG